MKQSKLMGLIKRWRGVLVIAPSVAFAVIVGSSLGLFQLLEQANRDTFIRFRPRESMEDAIVIVTIDEPDIQALGNWPIPDQALAEAIRQLRVHEPRVIGLDLYRNLSVEPGTETLLEVFRTTPNLIGVEKVIGVPVPPPPILQEAEQFGIADFVLDGDGKVRRALVSIQKDDELPKLGLAVRVALDYLAAEGIVPEMVDPERQQIRLGQILLNPLRSGEAGYGERGGYQILLNWRGTRTKFHTLSIQDVLTKADAVKIVRDRIVFIGSVAPSTRDVFETPLQCCQNWVGKSGYGRCGHSC